MSLTDLSVFVYGTLKPGGHYWPRFCEGKVLEPLPAKIHGELYELPLGYPALLRRGLDWVHGYVLTFPRKADFAEVDRLEGYSPVGPEEDNEFNRLKVDCFDPEGRRLGKVWTYEMSLDTIHGLGGERVADGNWPAGGD